MYEHSIPAKIIRTELLESERDKATVANPQTIREVTLLLRKENKTLKDAKLRS